MTSEGGRVTWVTWNVQGLNNPKKTRQVLAYLDRHNVQVALLQETHLNKHAADKVASRWAGVKLVSSYFSYARGVMILVKKKSSVCNITCGRG